MMTKESTLEIMRQQGKTDALDLQARSAGMTGTEIIAEENKVPAFDPTKDYTKWPAGAPVVDDGQVWTLLQPYNAAHYTGRPADLRALWGLAHTKDPYKAKSWVEPYGTSGLYQVDECCIYNEKVWRNLYNNNEYPPETLNVEDRWEEINLI